MTKTLDRRGFLKTAALAGAAGLAARASASSAASTEIATPKLTYKPGTYSAKAPGISSDVTVKAVFDEHRIVDVLVDVSGETKGIGADIGDLMAERMLKAQDCSVDGVSGATVTSNAARTALADCMSQASGTTVTVKLEVDGAKIEEDLEKVVPKEVVKAEAVVLGCGAAGIEAALVLQAAGVKTRLLEKGRSCGVSNGSQAGGPALAQTRVQAAQNATVSVKTLYECQYGFSRGTVDGALLRKCVNEGERVVASFMDNGVNMGLRRDAYGMGFRARHNFADKDGRQLRGVDRFGPLVKKFEAMGGVFETQREAVKLVKTGEAVTGVLVKRGEDGAYVRYDAKGVLVATGGYAGNDEMIREHFGDINVMPLCNTLSNGAGFRMVVEAGGVPDRNWALCCNEFGGANRKCAKQGKAIVRSNDALRFAIYGGLIVNAVGERFMNEQYLSDRPLALGGEMSLRAGRYYAVLDDEMYARCRDEGIFAYFGSPKAWYVGSTGFAGERLAKLDRDMAEAVERKWAASGTLAECARAFGLTHLEETVEKYNALCRRGEDDEFYKSGYLLKALNGKKFWVVEYEPSIWCTFGGVKTDAHCRALTPAQAPIPGLYVAGVDNGSLYASPYYENEGAALGTAFTSGIVAGDAMVRFLKG